MEKKAQIISQQVEAGAPGGESLGEGLANLAFDSSENEAFESQAKPSWLRVRCTWASCLFVQGGMYSWGTFTGPRIIGCQDGYG